MNKNDKKFHNSIVKSLIWFHFVNILFGDIFLHKFQKIAEEFEIKIPILILFKDGRKEILVSNKFKPSKSKVRIKKRINFMEFLCKNVVKSRDFLFGEIIFFSSSITNKVEEKFEESSLEVIFGILSRLIFGKHMNNCL